MTQIVTTAGNTLPSGTVAGDFDSHAIQSGSGGAIQSRKMEGPPLIVTGAGDVTLTRAHTCVILKKSTPAATQVNLPDPTATGGLPIGHEVEVIDGLRDANTNNITVATPGAETIGGSATLVMNQAGQTRVFKWDGTEWHIVRGLN